MVVAYDSRMPRKQQTSLLEEIYEAASKLPWWACLFLAVISFGVGHMLSSTKATGSTMPEAITTILWSVTGIAVKIVGPLVFLLAAAASGFRQMQTKRVDDPPRSALPTEPCPYTGDVPDVPDDHLYDVWKDVTRSQGNGPSIDTTRWSMELLKALEWKRFEHLCAAYFETLGFTTKVAREGADGGIDIHLYPAGSTTPGIIVQCKAWSRYVGVKPIRELLGVMTDVQITEGIFVTTSRYTDDAIRFATGNNLHLIDGEDLLTKIAATSAEQQTRLLQLATAGDFTTPTCPSCGIKMVERVTQKTGERFWGCTGFPRCRRTFHQASDKG